MRTSMLGVAILVLAMTGAADAQFGLARFAAAVSDDRAAVRVWKHHLDAGTRRDIAERAAARSRTPDGARRITLKSEPTPAQQKRVTVTDLPARITSPRATTRPSFAPSRAIAPCREKLSRVRDSKAASAGVKAGTAAGFTAGR